MSIQSLLFSILQLLLVVVLLISFIYILHLLLRRILKTGAEGESVWNWSYSIFFSALLFSSGLLFKETGMATLSVVKILERGASQNSLAFEIIKYALYFTGMGIICLIIIIALTSYLFFIIRKEGILTSIANNDFSGLIFYGVGIITFTLISLGYFRQILEYMIPYPSIPGFN
jgi:hypothetical protein